MEIALIFCYGTSQHRGDLREKQLSLSVKGGVACLHISVIFSLLLD